MSSNIHVTADTANGYTTTDQNPDEVLDEGQDHEGVVGNAPVRDALSGLDVSESSPVTASGNEFGIALEDGEVHVRVQGHDGEWSDGDEAAVLDALKAVDGVDVESVGVESGGASTTGTTTTTTATTGSADDSDESE